MFPDDSKSMAMIRHALNVIRIAVKELNPAQVPIVTLDQPLYSLAKQVQWCWPETHGEEHFVIILGGLHIEMCCLKMIGEWLQDSGWVDAIVQAKVASPGTAESLLKASHVSRSRRAHQITACSLFILLKKAYNKFIEDCDDSMSPTLEDWCEAQSRRSPQFLFWLSALKLQLLVLVYIRSVREGSFALYIDALTKLAAWCFSMDHTNYARWLPVHVRDMASLGERHPCVLQEFLNGRFTVQKTKSPFSAMAIDQAHEQNNAHVKGEGGAIGLTQNPELLQRWMVAGPEVARLVGEFESSLKHQHKLPTATTHHEHGRANQANFGSHVQSLVDVIDEMGNPFADNGSQLYRIDTKEVFGKESVEAVQHIERIGQEQYENYLTTRLNGDQPISDPIKKNKFLIFNKRPVRQTSKESQKVSHLKNDCALFSRLYIACQTREGNLEEFFRHENQSYPPSLSQNGFLRSGKKADLLSCLESEADTQRQVPECDCIILDGAVIVNMIRPTGCKTFSDYALQKILPYVEFQLKRVNRVDIVWDTYKEHSLKAHTRTQRGKGVRRMVTGNVCVPHNWQEFLREDRNKAELFAFLAMHIEAIQTDKTVITTHNGHVLSTNTHDTSALAPRNHEEADTRMFVHAADAVNQGCQKIMIRTVDTDVVTIAVSVIASIDITELWVAFGTGRHLRYIPAHSIALSLGAVKSKVLPMFHAYTGCDTVSFFANRGKKTAWDIWKTFDNLTEAFHSVIVDPDNITEEVLSTIERFTVLLYNRTSMLSSVDAARMELFVKKGRGMEDIPPTKDARMLHFKRSVFQGAYCWGTALQLAPELPSPSSWGWSNLGQWYPVWTTIPEASQATRELLRCGCQKGCRKACRCVRAALKCTALCHCGGDCREWVRIL